MRFQTLIGTVKTQKRGPTHNAGPPFQTLIGTVKTRPPIPLPSGPLAVSNPHRYGQNPPATRGGYPPHAFQTLIGTVKTRTRTGPSGPRPRFQTLIGTVKTRCRAGRRLGGTLVSNPHRYGQNGLGAWFLQELVGFQTLIGTVKTHGEGHRGTPEKRDRGRIGDPLPLAGPGHEACRTGDT